MEINFNNLRLGDTIYFLNKDFAPEIVPHQVTGIRKADKDSLQITLKLEDTSFICNIQKKYANTNQFWQYYLIKEDCEKRLEEICIQGIITLSKIIGGLNGSSC